MQYVVNRAGDRNVIADIDFHQSKTVAPLKVDNILGRPGHEVIETNHFDVIC